MQLTASLVCCDPEAVRACQPCMQPHDCDTSPDCQRHLQQGPIHSLPCTAFHRHPPCGTTKCWTLSGDMAQLNHPFLTLQTKATYRSCSRYRLSRSASYVQKCIPDADKSVRSPQRLDKKRRAFAKKKLESVTAVTDSNEPKYIHRLDKNPKKDLAESEKAFELEAVGAGLGCG
eukprot:364803-Chlamydomonas_euryale.AAC.3